MQHVASADGTQIAYEKRGRPAARDHRRLARRSPLLHPARDRVGAAVHGLQLRPTRPRQSGDTQPYAVERELDDLAALVADAGQPVLVYGHSAGSAFALRAAAAGLQIAKLVLADPPFARHSDADDKKRSRQAEEAATIQAFHDRGDHRGNAAFFLSGFGLPRAAVDDMLDAPAGQMMIDSARALPYDYAMVGDGLVPDELAARVEVPTVVLAPEAAPESAKALVELLADGRLQTLTASTHDLTPTEIAAAVVPFLR